MEVFQEIFMKPKASKLTERVEMKIIGFDVEKEEIVEWKT
jgi:hypothetical protein